MKEMVDSLTQKKLADTIKQEELEKTLSSYEISLHDLRGQLSKFNETAIENEALKRQIQRLTSDNDDLLVKLEAADNSDELRKQIECLKTEHEEKAREMKSMKDMMDKNSAKIKKLIQENSDLKASLDSRDDKTPTDQVKIKYDKCIKKLRVYREKIYDISEKFQLLKADREILMTTTKEYSQYVTSWQKDIATASFKMIERIRELSEDLRKKNEENEVLKKEVHIVQDENEALKKELHEAQKLPEVLPPEEPSFKTFETEIKELKDLVKAKDKLLAEEKEAHKKAKQTVKKPSVMDLEMEAYEKTLDELNRKLEAKKLEVNEFEKTIEMTNETMESLKSQITLLESNLESEKVHSLEVKKNLDSQLQLLRKTEHERTEANLQLEMLTKNFEAQKNENCEAKLEMAKHVADLEQRYQSNEAQKNEQSKTIAALENDVEKFKKLSMSHEKEVESLRTEFAGYKVRAQSVLRQSQTKDMGKEQELQEELLAIQQTMESLKTSNVKLVSELEVLKKSFAEATDDKVRLQSRCKDLLEALEKQSDEVLEESRKRNQQHDESIKAYQLQIDTLNAFYKKKIKEDDESNSKTISELKAQISKFEKASHARAQVFNEYPPSMYQQMKHDDEKLNVLLVDREEAEGSEDQSSQSSTFHIPPRRKISRGRELMPLDELLNSSFDDNSNEVNEETVSNYSSRSEALGQTKAKLAREENRVSLLTALLADSEKDLARMQQLNDLLKEEVRRQQRNFDREEHIKNSEYLKNIVVKFVTLTNGDEKQRLIPVLNTILRLSSEENVLLQNACKTGWSGLWSK